MCSSVPRKNLPLWGRWPSEGSAKRGRMRLLHETPHPALRATVAVAVPGALLGANACVAHRPLPLAQLPRSATGGGRIAPSQEKAIPHPPQAVPTANL